MNKDKKWFHAGAGILLLALGIFAVTFAGDLVDSPLPPGRRPPYTPVLLDIFPTPTENPDVPAPFPGSTCTIIYEPAEDGSLQVVGTPIWSQFNPRGHLRNWSHGLRRGAYMSHLAGVIKLAGELNGKGAPWIEKALKKPMKFVPGPTLDGRRVMFDPVEGGGDGGGGQTSCWCGKLFFVNGDLTCQPGPCMGCAGCVVYP